MRAGAIASYTVTLRNSSGTPVQLTPCPAYTEYLALPGPRRPSYLTRNYYLNCAAVRRIAAQASVTFTMRMPVPAGAAQAKWGWQLQGTGVATALNVTIRGRSR